jgi:hypothetical protein
MADRAIDVYLNDHLGGAMLGADLAQQIWDRHDGTPLGDVMAKLTPAIEEDRDTLEALMERMDTTKNPLKQAAGWVAEKASRVKFSGIASGEPDHGAFMALESLALGVEGKASMWKALKSVQSEYPALAETNLDELLERANSQYDVVEKERLAAAARALNNSEDRG